MVSSTSLQAVKGLALALASSMNHTHSSGRCCCAAELSAVRVRSKRLFLPAGLMWEGIQSSDGCLMGLRAHTHHFHAAKSPALAAIIMQSGENTKTRASRTMILVLGWATTGISWSSMRALTLHCDVEWTGTTLPGNIFQQFIAGNHRWLQQNFPAFV